MPRIKRQLNDTNNSSGAQQAPAADTKAHDAGPPARGLRAWLHKLGAREIARLVAAVLAVAGGFMSLTAAIINHPDFVFTFVSLLQLVS